MLTTYEALIEVAVTEFSDLVTQTQLVGGTQISPNKLRIFITDSSFVDIWLSADGDYAYHWERRKQTGEIYRWDNAPHHPHISTFPDHLHQGDERTIVESNLNPNLGDALREVLTFVRQHV